MSNIHVIIMCDSYKKNINHLKTLFNSFDITVLSEKEIISKKSLLSYDEYKEKYNYLQALKMARLDDRPCLIIKNTSLCLLNPDDLKNYILDVLNMDIDLCFLCTWQDECHKYINDTTHVKWTQHSHATQAILYKTNHSKKSIYKFLYESKSSLSSSIKYNIHQLKAIVFTPNIIHFDISQATSNEDYHKVNCCLPVPISAKPINTTNNAAWIIIIMIFIVLLAVLVPYFRHSNKL